MPPMVKNWGWFMHPIAPKKMTPKKSYGFQHVNFILYESVIPFWDPGIPIE